jgi:hypothetical protein
MTVRLYSDEMKELMATLNQVKKVIDDLSQRPEHKILDDVDLCNFLKVSKRTSAYWRERAEITYSKLGGKIYYRLSDILELIKKNEVPAIKPYL